MRNEIISPAPSIRATGAASSRGRQVKATGRNGVLDVSIAKQAKALPRRIKVAA
jgi:hypothetical protein